MFLVCFVLWPMCIGTVSASMLSGWLRGCWLGSSVSWPGPFGFGGWGNKSIVWVAMVAERYIRFVCTTAVRLVFSTFGPFFGLWLAYWDCFHGGFLFRGCVVLE
jgi:hypothetical protein